jgi:GR25 family glycosyltransferase involved in LPS biosynthesis
MRTVHPLAFARDPAHLDTEPLHGLMEHVPNMDLQFNGDCAQANGVELPIVVINLPHRTDRWQVTSRRMSAVGLTKLIRAPAIEGARLPDDQIVALLRSPTDATVGAPQSHLTLTRPAIGCFLSHLAIWRWVIGADLPRVLVLEDDAAPAEHFNAAHLRSLLARIPGECGLVFLGCMIMGGLADRPEGANLARLYYFNGTFAYLITPAACRRLLAHLLPMHAHIDHQISNVLIEQRLRLPAYYAAPQFFEPDWSLLSDCYVPLCDDTLANRDLGQIIEASRRLLLDEGRALLSIPSTS